MPGAAVIMHAVNCARSARTALGDHSDAAKRLSDTYRLHRAAQGQWATGRWFAFALADGRTDGVLYDDRAGAVRHQHHNERYFGFVCINPGDMTPCEAEDVVALWRDIQGQLTDYEHRTGGLEVIPRVTVEDQRSLAASIASRGRRRPSGLVYPGE